MCCSGFFMAWESDNSFNHAMQFLLRLWQYFLSDNLTERLRRSHFWPREWNFKKRGSEGVLFSQSAVPMQPRKIRGYGGALDSQSEQEWGGLERLEESSAGQEQQGAVCLLLGSPAAYIRVLPHALPSVTLRLSDTEIKESGASGFSRGHDTTTSHGTLGILGNTYSNV